MASEARLHHAGRRPGRREPRRDDREDRRARPPRRRGRRALRPRRRRRAARPTAACASFGAPTRAQRARRYVAALVAELRAAPASRSSPTWCRSTRSSPRPFVRLAPRPARALVHALEGARRPPRSRRSSARTCIERRRALVPAAARASCTASGTAIDLDEFPCRRRPRPGERSASLSLGRYSPAKRLDELIEGVRIARDARPRRPHRPLRHDRHSGGGGAYTRRARGARLAGPSTRVRSVGGPIPRTELPARARAGGRRRLQLHLAGQDRLEACSSCRPVLASQPALRRRCSPGSSRRSRSSAGVRRRSPTGIEALAALERRGARTRSGGRCGSASRAQPLGRHVGGRHHSGWSSHEARLDPPPAEGRGHLRLGGAPALAAAAAARARLGHPHADAARGRAGRLGLRARARPRAACRSTRSASARDVDPIAFVRARRVPRAQAPGDPAHAPRARATPTGCSPARVARVPVRFSTKHGFNEFRETPYFGLADRAVASLAHVAHRDLARPRALSRGGRGLRRRELRDRPLRDRARTASRRRTRARRRGCSASAG